MKVAIIIKSFGRSDSLISTIRSISDFCNLGFRLYVIQDGLIPFEHQEYLSALSKEGHFIATFENPIGTNKARNIAVENLLDEDYVLRIDDDFEFSEGTDIKKMGLMLASIPDLGVLGDLEKQRGKGKGLIDNQINDRYGYFNFIKEDLVISMRGRKFKYETENTVHGKVFICDLIRNFLLIKRQVFDHVKWDENIFFKKEHEDFLLNIKQSEWRVGFTDQSFHYHNEQYIRYNGDKIRPSNSLFDKDEKYFKSKWNIENIRIELPFKMKLVRKLKSLFH